MCWWWCGGADVVTTADDDADDAHGVAGDGGSGEDETKLQRLSIKNYCAKLFDQL